MLILIAESKTMLDEQQKISAEMLRNHTPPGEEQADLIIGGLERLSQSELIAETGFSSSLAARLRKMIHEFPNKSLGLKAVEAFTGVVFKALQYDTLDNEARARCVDSVGIISSLYGYLRPEDIIKPYRLDFTTKAAPNGSALNTFWRKDVTIQLVRSLQNGGHKELLNLLPGDAAKCVDWKLVKNFCKVWKVDFVEMVEEGKTKTPASNKLKTMRGKLLHQILQEGIVSAGEIARIKSEDYLHDSTPVYPDHLQFLC